MAYLLVIQDGILSPDSAALSFLEFLEFPFFFFLIFLFWKRATNAQLLWKKNVKFISGLLILESGHCLLLHLACYNDFWGPCVNTSVGEKCEW